MFDIAVFILAFLLVMAEEFAHLRKSKLVILAAGIIWSAIGLYYTSHGTPIWRNMRYGIICWNMRS